VILIIDKRNVKDTEPDQLINYCRWMRSLAYLQEWREQLIYVAHQDHGHKSSPRSFIKMINRGNKPTITPGLSPWICKKWQLLMALLFYKEISQLRRRLMRYWEYLKGKRLIWWSVMELLMLRDSMISINIYRHNYCKQL